jgi:hypothetical protein
MESGMRIIFLLLVFGLSQTPGVVAVEDLIRTSSQKQLGAMGRNPEDFTKIIYWKYIKDASSRKQFEKDKEIFLQTLFSQNLNGKKIFSSLSPKDKLKYLEKIKFIKKLIFLIAGAGLQYTIRDNDYQHLRPWPFPIVSAFSHGQRILFIIRQTKAEEVFNFLTSNKKSGIARRRMMASHSVKLNKNNPVEIKLKGFIGSMKNLWDGIRAKHFGVNIPLGGMGIIGPSGEIIGESGNFLTPELNPISGKQHGHFYLRVDDFSKQGLSTILVGLEDSAPGKTSWFGERHAPRDAFSDQTKKLSPTMGSKWKEMDLEGMEPPAEYGGKVVELDRNQFKALESRIERIMASNEISKEFPFFEKVLMKNGPEAREFFNQYYP